MADHSLPGQTLNDRSQPSRNTGLFTIVIFMYNSEKYRFGDQRSACLMRKSFCVLLGCLICVLALMPGCSALGDTRTPAPISYVPYDELPPVIEGQHHYLMLCVDLWKSRPRPEGIDPPTGYGGRRRDLYGNTDGIVLVTLDTRAHRIMLTSLIRDALIHKPNEGIGRINYVYNDYGPEALCKTISEHIGVRIEKYILFDFTQIANIVDFLDGVDVDLKSYEIDYLRRYAVPPGSVRALSNGLDLRAGGHHPEGTYHFRGHSAVIYMRIRKAGGGGDFMRTQRVRTVLSSLADKCRNITWEDTQALVNNVMENNNTTNMNLEELMEAASFAFALKDCTIEELRLPPDGAVTPINYLEMAAQEVDWEACRVAMADYLQNSFLVIDDEE